MTAISWKAARRHSCRCTNSHARVNELFNLIVDLDERFERSPQTNRAAESIPGVSVAAAASSADDTVLAWIDLEFGGSWSSEARAGANVLAFRDGQAVGFATFDAKGLRFRWLRGLARERDVGIFGPFGVAPDERRSELGPALLQLALTGLRERGYARALIPAVGDDRLQRYYADTVGARVAERFERDALTAPRPRTLVMASGNGSNFQAVADRARAGDLPIDVIGVVTNDPDAFAAQRARAAEIDVTIVPWIRKQEARADYDTRLLEAVRARQPDLVLLLGWMHVLDERFLRAFPGVINVHPAFLPLEPSRDDVGMPDGTRIPAFRGPCAVRDALAAGSSWTGATVHAVTPATDRGPVLARKPMRVDAGEGQAQVLERLHPVEHQLVAAGVMRWLYER
jgi:phosphoribosylglycinamide formyltransferase-1